MERIEEELGASPFEVVVYVRSAEVGYPVFVALMMAECIPAATL
jgi:hypothetical protein